MRARIVTPRKPNSAKRPVAKVVLVNKKRVTAHIPGIGHSIRRYSKVMISGVGARDLPGVRYSLIRGIMDFHGLLKKKRRRSIYAAPQPDGIKRMRRKLRIKMSKQSLSENQKVIEDEIAELPDIFTDNDMSLLNNQVFKKTKFEGFIESKIKSLEKKKLIFTNLFLVSSFYVNFKKKLFAKDNTSFFDTIELLVLLITTMNSSYFFDIIDVDTIFDSKLRTLRSVRMLREHRALLSNFFIKIHHNLDFYAKDAYRFFSVSKKKFFIYLNEKNILSLNNMSKIRIPFLLNYNSSAKERFNSKFLDVDAIIKDDETMLTESVDSCYITYFNRNVAKLFRRSVNPYNFDIFDMIFFTPVESIELSKIAPVIGISSSMREKLYYNRYEYHQFEFSRSEVSYIFFKLCDVLNNNFFFDIPVEFGERLYEEMSNTFLHNIQTSMFGIFDTNFNLFNRHVASLLIDNKVNNFKKKKVCKGLFIFIFKIKFFFFWNTITQNILYFLWRSRFW